LLVGVGDLEDRFLASGPPSYLETNWQTLGTEPTGSRTKRASHCAPTKARARWTPMTI